MSVTFRGERTSFHFALKNGEVCIFCRCNVFNDSLRKLLETEVGKSVDVEYSQISIEIYRAFLAGCPWCKILAEIVASIAEHVNSLDADSDESDNEPDYNTPPVGLLSCGATLKIVISFIKTNSDSCFDAVTVKIETQGSVVEHGCMPRLAGRDTIHLEFEVSADESSVFQRHWGRISADCDDWVLTARTWLQACQQHPKCRLESSFMPSRVLDVTNPTLPKLTTRTAVPFGQDRTYCTLSYVWGTARVYTLTAQTQSLLLEGIDSSLLPRTIRDAIHAASQLQIRYLWVDALCILQDSDNDKAIELPQMANIYRCSALTISAASAEASSEGFLRPPDGLFDPKRPPISLPLGVEGGKQVCFRLGTSNRGLSLGKESIFKRAWTYQEQLLSHRNLLFRRDGVAWECLEHRVTYESTTPWKQGESVLRLFDIGAPAEKQAIYERWLSIRMDYCQRDLTFLGDKMNAISALASEISRLTSWTYLAGLWLEQLLNDLLWCHVSPKNTWDRVPDDYPILRSTRACATEAVAPSWSWASVLEGPIYDTDIGTREPYHFQVLSHKIKIGNAGPFGSVRTATLTVFGKLIMLSFRPIFRPDELDLADVALFAAHQPENIVAFGVTDPLDAALAPDTILTCLGVATSVFMGREVCEGLMLLPNDGQSHRRVGFFRAYDLSMFQAAAQQQIVLC